MTDQQPAGPRRRFSSFYVATLAIAMVIGAGIFQSPAYVASNVDGAFWLFGVWILGGVISLTFEHHAKPPQIEAVVYEMCEIILAAAGDRQLAYPVEECFQLYWSALHGLLSLSLADRLPYPPEQAYTLVEKSVRALSAGVFVSNE